MTDTTTEPASHDSPPALDPLAMAERVVKLLEAVEQSSAPVATALALMEQVRDHLKNQRKAVN